MITLQIHSEPNVAYVYDDAGRRISRSATTEGPPETPLTASYDAANRVVALTLAGINYTLAYDANGNLTHKVSDAGITTRYLWSARGVMRTQVAEGGYPDMPSRPSVARRKAPLYTSRNDQVVPKQGS